MKFYSQLETGVFLRRYKRFFAEIQWQEQILTAHLPNTGSLKTCSVSGSPCRFSVSDDPRRKLKCTLEMIQAPEGHWVGVNTHLPNRLVREALQNQLLLHWQDVASFRQEVRISRETRFDFELTHFNGNKTYLEVKSVTMAVNGQALFPDAKTERGQKHLRELMALSKAGHGAELVFAIQREGIDRFAPAHEVDPVYSRLLWQARESGVKITPVMVSLSAEEASLTAQTVPLAFAGST